jgi:hypothetical protein
MRHSVRLGSTALGLAFASLTAWATFGTAACVVTTSDTTDSGTTDDTGTPPVDAPAGTVGGIKVLASSLLGTAANGEATAFGKGSTYAEISAYQIAYAYVKIGAGSASAVGTEFPSSSQTPIGVDASGTQIDGQILNLVPGSYNLDVTGYLRGVTGDLIETPATRVPFMKASCTVTVAVDTVTAATCTPLALTDSSNAFYFKGIIFPSDFLGASGGKAYKATTSGADLDVWRARTPTSGTAAASVAESDPEGVIFIDEAKFKSTEAAARETQWSISVELKTASISACTTAPGCKVVRLDGTTPVDLVVVNPATGDHANCIANPTTTKTTACFQ